MQLNTATLANLQTALADRTPQNLADFVKIADLVSVVKPNQTILDKIRPGLLDLIKLPKLPFVPTTPAAPAARSSIPSTCSYSPSAT